MDFSPTSTSSGSSNLSQKAGDYPEDAVSPGIMSSDLGLDPSDPLNLLLHNTSQDGASTESSKLGSVPDWSQLTTLWPAHDRYLADGLKYPDMGIDFNLPLSMNMDYNPSMAVEPSALHFEPSYNQPSFFSSNVPLSGEFFPPSFPFTFGSDESSSASSHSDSRHRRLSVTSSSSSGASLSPIIESKTPSIARFENPADELAQRVRQSAGVLLAVPTGLHGQINTSQS
jgi:hypothetical protein